MKIGDDDTVVHAFGLVDGEQDVAPGLAQPVGNFLVQGRHPATAVDHENHHIGLVNRLFGLARHLVHDAVFGERFETTGINHQIGFAAESSVAVMTVTRQPRNIGHQSIARPGQPVEERRFADIRTPDENDAGLHWASIASTRPLLVCSTRLLPRRCKGA
jgi:hypothetical protein